MTESNNPYQAALDEAANKLAAAQKDVLELWWRWQCGVPTYEPMPDGFDARKEEYRRAAA